MHITRDVAVEATTLLVNANPDRSNGVCQYGTGEGLVREPVCLVGHALAGWGVDLALFDEKFTGATWSTLNDQPFNNSYVLDMLREKAEVTFDAAAVAFLRRAQDVLDEDEANTPWAEGLERALEDEGRSDSDFVEYWGPEGSG